MRFTKSFDGTIPFFFFKRGVGEENELCTRQIGISSYATNTIFFFLAGISGMNNELRYFYSSREILGYLGLDFANNNVSS